MSPVANFVVVSGKPCSYCMRAAERVVHVPLTRAGDDDDARVDFCAYCVLAMARALSQAQGQTA